MSYEIPVLFNKINADISDLIQKKFKVKSSDITWKADSLEFPVNGGKKKIKLKIILE